MTSIAAKKTFPHPQPGKATPEKPSEAPAKEESADPSAGLFPALTKVFPTLSLVPLIVRLVGESPLATGKSEEKVATDDPQKFYETESLALNKLEAGLLGTLPENSDAALAKLKQVESLAQQYLQLSTQEEGDTGQLLAERSYGLLEKVAGNWPYPEIQKRAELYAAYHKLAAQDFDGAREAFKALKGDFDEAFEIVKRMKADELRSRNLTALNVWEVSLEDGKTVAIDQAHGLLGIGSGIITKLVDDKTTDDYVYERYQIEKDLITKVRDMIKSSKEKSIDDALLEIEDPRLLPRAKQLLDERKGGGDDGSYLIAHLIRYVSENELDEGKARVLFRDADQTEARGWVKSAYAFYSFLQATASSEDFKKSCDEKISKLENGKTLGDRLWDMIRTTTAEDVAWDILVMKGCQALGALAKVATLGKLTRAGITGYKATALVFSAEVLAEGTAFGTTQLAQEAANHDVEQVFTPGHILKVYACNLIMVGGLKGFGEISAKYAPRAAHALEMVKADGTLSRGGEVLVGALNHGAGLGGMVTTTQVNQTLGLTGTPEGGFLESLAHDVFSYVKYGFAQKGVEKLMGPELEKRSQELSQKIITMQTALMIEAQLKTLGYEAVQRTEEGVPVFKNVQTQKLYIQLIRESLSKPGFDAGKLGGLLREKKNAAAETYLKGFGLDLEHFGIDADQLKAIQASADRQSLRDSLNLLRSPILAPLFAMLGIDGFGGSDSKPETSIAPPKIAEISASPEIKERIQQAFRNKAIATVSDRTTRNSPSLSAQVTNPSETVEVSLDLAKLTGNSQYQGNSLRLEMVVDPHLNQIRLSDEVVESLQGAAQEERDPALKQILQSLVELKKVAIIEQTPEGNPALTAGEENASGTLLPKTDPEILASNQQTLGKIDPYKMTRNLNAGTPWSLVRGNYLVGSIRLDPQGRIVGTHLSLPDHLTARGTTYQRGVQAGGSEIPVVVLDGKIVWCDKLSQLNPAQQSQVLELTKGSAERLMRDPYGLDAVFGKDRGVLAAGVGSFLLSLLFQGKTEAKLAIIRNETGQIQVLTENQYLRDSVRQSGRWQLLSNVDLALQPAANTGGNTLAAIGLGESPLESLGFRLSTEIPELREVLEYAQRRYAKSTENPLETSETNKALPPSSDDGNGGKLLGLLGLGLGISALFADHVAEASQGPAGLGPTETGMIAAIGSLIGLGFVGKKIISAVKARFKARAEAKAEAKEKTTEKPEPKQEKPDSSAKGAAKVLTFLGLGLGLNALLNPETAQAATDAVAGPFGDSFTRFLLSLGLGLGVLGLAKYRPRELAELIPTLDEGRSYPSGTLHPTEVETVLRHYNGVPRAVDLDEERRLGADILPAGTRLFYGENGRLFAIRATQPSRIRGGNYEAGDRVYFDADARPEFAVLHESRKIQGLDCAAEFPVFFDAQGKISRAKLASQQERTEGSFAEGEVVDVKNGILSKEESILKQWLWTAAAGFGLVSNGALMATADFSQAGSGLMGMVNLVATIGSLFFFTRDLRWTKETVPRLPEDPMPWRVRVSPPKIRLSIPDASGLDPELDADMELAAEAEATMPPPRKSATPPLRSEEKTSSKENRNSKPNLEKKEGGFGAGASATLLGFLGFGTALGALLSPESAQAAVDVTTVGGGSALGATLTTILFGGVFAWGAGKVRELFSKSEAAEKKSL